jgi:hypothetical protein
MINDIYVVRKLNSAIKGHFNGFAKQIRYFKSFMPGLQKIKLNFIISKITIHLIKIR